MLKRITSGRLSWIAPPFLLAAVDLTVRARAVPDWYLADWELYLGSIAYVLLLLVVWRWIKGRWPNGRPALFRTVAIGLGTLTACMYVGQYIHYFLLGILPNAAIFRYFFDEPGEFSSVVIDAADVPALAGLGLGILAASGLWAMALALPAGAVRERRFPWAALAGLALLTPVLFHNVPLAQGAALPSVNASFSFAKAARVALNGPGQYRRVLYSWARDPVPAQPGPLPMNVLLIIGESLNANRIPALGHDRPTTPEQDRMMAKYPDRFFPFTRFYSNSTSTRESLPSLVTGVHPLEDFRKLHRLPLVFEYGKAFPGTETFLFSSHSYRMNNFRAFFESPQLDRLYAREDAGVPAFNNKGMDDAHTTDALVDFLARRDRQRRFFGIVHYNATHFPYRVPEAFLKWGDGSVPDRYDNAVLYYDHNVGRVLAALEEGGYLDDTAVLATADHSEGLGEHGVWTHGQTFYESIIHVPAWAYLPPDLARRHGAALRANRNLPHANLDLVPTVIGLLGLESDLTVRRYRGELLGRNLLDEPREPQAIFVQNGYSDSDLAKGYGLLYGDLRLAFHSSGGHFEIKAFDLSQDPEEQVNLWGQLPEPTLAMVREVIAGFPHLESMTPPELRTVTPSAWP